jgi:hypothetical protein
MQNTCYKQKLRQSAGLFAWERLPVALASSRVCAWMEKRQMTGAVQNASAPGYAPVSAKRLGLR